MISKKLETALNNQINAELWSSYLYLSMASHFGSGGFLGFANWFNVQSREEYDHALIQINYLHSRGGKITLAPIAKVKTSWASLDEALKDTQHHEQKMTGLIHNLYELASNEKDYATVRALQWFVDEQVEEEENVQNLIDKLKLISNDGSGMYMLDNEQAARVYVQPLPLTGKLIK